MQPTMMAQLLMDALLMAIFRRGRGRKRYCIIPAKAHNTAVRTTSGYWMRKALSAA
jgi:hypothetical protein